MLAVTAMRTDTFQERLFFSTKNWTLLGEANVTVVLFHLEPQTLD